MFLFLHWNQFYLLSVKSPWMNRPNITYICFVEPMVDILLLAPECSDRNQIEQTKLQGTSSFEHVNRDMDHSLRTPECFFGYGVWIPLKPVNWYRGLDNRANHCYSLKIFLFFGCTSPSFFVETIRYQPLWPCEHRYSVHFCATHSKKALVRCHLDPCQYIYIYTYIHTVYIQNH